MSMRVRRQARLARGATLVLAALAVLLGDVCQSDSGRERAPPPPPRRAWAAARSLARARAEERAGARPGAPQPPRAHGVCALRGGRDDDADASGGCLLGKRPRGSDAAGEGAGSGGSDTAARARAPEDAQRQMDTSKLGLLLQRAAAYSGRSACTAPRRRPLRAPRSPGRRGRLAL